MLKCCPTVNTCTLLQTLLSYNVLFLYPVLLWRNNKRVIIFKKYGSAIFINFVVISQPVREQLVTWVLAPLTYTLSKLAVEMWKLWPSIQFPISPFYKLTEEIISHLFPFTLLICEKARTLETLPYTWSYMWYSGRLPCYVAVTYTW